MARLKIKLTSQNIDYAVLTKAADNPKILERWKSRHAELGGVLRVLPDGAKRMKIGTMVEADDGDICFSLPERDIDNWLFAQGIRHRKEVKYPDSDLRREWELLGSSQRVFVEYFGLMNLSAYAEKARNRTKPCYGRLTAVAYAQRSPVKNLLPLDQVVSRHYHASSRNWRCLSSGFKHAVQF